MKRSGFKRLEVVHMPPSVPRRLERPPVMADCSAMQQPHAKPEPQRNPHLLSMARGRPCLLRTTVCSYDTTTTVAAHSNLLAHGKGRGRKADDCYSVWACARCHAWLDGSYDAEFEEKESAFMRALMAQADEWKAIADSAVATAKDRGAAQWALKRLQTPQEVA
ncbi:nuclease domain-containing protein [Variovorax sp. RB3P1]|uniref:nuclease domain-containing protein n=1 Tax=Variovorax sp. RB3P1 TaxID=3443732 RepID=UPI003F47A5D7